VNVFGKFWWFVILLAFVANFVLVIYLFIIFELVTLSIFFKLFCRVLVISFVANVDELESYIA
jgi:hypothetical protein